MEPVQSGSRLDQFLARSLGFSRARLQRLLKSGRVLVNGEIRPASYRVRAADQVVVSVPEPAPSFLAPEALPLAILFEDQDLLVVNKPPGLVVHPGAGHRTGTLLNALVHHCPDLQDIGEVSRPGLVHRLDKDTSGLIVVAKTALAHANLVAQFQAHAITKHYQALVWGRLPKAEGEIDREVGRHPTVRQKMSVNPRRGKRAVTLWRVLKEYPGPLSLVELSPQTGRTHQLRVHLASYRPPGPGGRHLRRRGISSGGEPQTCEPQAAGAPPAPPRLAPGPHPPPHRRTPHLGSAPAGGFSGGGGFSG